MSLYRDQLENWIKEIGVNGVRVLDVGGGQLHIDKRVKYWNDIKCYHIVDNDAQYEPDYFLDINHDWDKAAEGVKIPKDYDVLFCLEVMEYVFDPIQAHKNLYASLKEGGEAYISYPTIYPLHNPPGIDYLRYTKFGIEKLLASVQFRTWEITPRIATGGIDALSSFYSLEGMRAMKGTRSIFDIGYMVRAIK